MFLLYLMIAAGLVAGTIYMVRLATEPDEPGVTATTIAENGERSFNADESAGYEYFEQYSEAFPLKSEDFMGPGGYFPGQFAGDR